MGFHYAALYALNTALELGAYFLEMDGAAKLYVGLF